MTTLYHISTKTACFGIEVENGIVTRHAPIAASIAGLRGSLVGQAWNGLQARYAARGATIAATEDPRAIWIKDRRTKAVVGYLCNGRLVRLANAGTLYAHWRRALREGQPNET